MAGKKKMIMKVEGEMTEEGSTEEEEVCSQNLSQAFYYLLQDTKGFYSNDGIPTKLKRILLRVKTNVVCGLCHHSTESD